MPICQMHHGPGDGHESDGRKKGKEPENKEFHESSGSSLVKKDGSALNKGKQQDDLERNDDSEDGFEDDVLSRLPAHYYHPIGGNAHGEAEVSAANCLALPAPCPVDGCISSEGEMLNLSLDSNHWNQMMIPFSQVEEVVEASGVIEIEQVGGGISQAMKAVVRRR
ncbi:hypothetical protein GUJ93_ZPchr0008g13750 [Zizania palustris]|uniref:Uncharacterized protein n=1 Tax=Zizania palustris TaxID=103762 RepID=A0A8J5VIK6_ZIZPA|nr:hypothetical protein GUJ93_ZPchr0008g13750 [Zizania palustris]